MTSAPLIVLLTDRRDLAVRPSIATDRDKPVEPTGTIKDLERTRVEVDTSAAIVGSEAKAMESYRLFLDVASDDPLLKAEAMRRLADLQLETADVEELASNVESLGSLGGTIDMYEKLLESYPNYAKNDLVLYQLARAYEAEGRIDESLVTLDRLIAQYPATSHLDEAQFRRGETLFVQKSYRESERAYQHVLDTGDGSPFYEQALYKHGWSMFKQQLYEESLPSFFGLLDRELGTDNAASGDRDPAELYAAMGRAQQELVDDTFRVLSIGFSYLDGPESISRYFNRRGSRPYAFIAYTNLGDLYLEQERYQDAADAYHAFVELDPYHAKAPLLQVEVIEAFKKGSFADLVLDGKENFVETYGPGSPYWQRFTFEQQPEVVAHLKSNVTDLAAYHHAEAQKTKETRASTRRPRVGTAPICNRSRTTRTPRQTNFLLAEVLFESGNFRDAAARVRAHGLRLSVPRQRRRGRLCGAARVREARGRAARQRQRADWHRRGIDSSLRFAEAYPSHEQAAPVQTDAAEKLFALGEFAPRARRRPARGRAHAAGRADACSARRGRSSRTRSSISRTSPRPRSAYVQLADVHPGRRPAARRDRRAHRVLDLQARRASARGRPARRRRDITSCASRRRRRRRRCARRPSTTPARR